MGIAVKFGINTTSVVLEMVNFTRLRPVKFIPISNTTLVVFIPNFTAISRVKFTISNTTRVIFIPNFTATHAITSTNRIEVVAR